MRRPWPGRRRPAGLPGAARSLLSTGAGARRYGRWRSTPTAGAPALWRPRPGTVPHPTRSADCDLLGKHAFGPQLVDGMVGVDDAHRAGSRAQDHRLRVRVDVLVAHSLQQLTGRDSCGREEDVGARAKVVEAEHLVRLVAFFNGHLLLLVVPEMELRLHVAADRLDRARREHAFGAPPDPIMQWTPDLVSSAASSAAATSPAVISLMRAPTSRIWAITSRFRSPSRPTAPSGWRSASRAGASAASCWPGPGGGAAGGAPASVTRSSSRARLRLIFGSSIIGYATYTKPPGSLR